MLEDGEAVLAALNGDPSAFRALFDRHVDGVRRVASRRAYHHEVDDVVQEAFARALEGLPRLKDPERFGAYVHGIVSYVCADLGRTKPRERCRDPHLLDQVTFEAGYQQVEAAMLVDQAMAAVDERNGAAVLARDGYGVETARISGATGRTIGAEQVQATRTRRAMAIAVGRVAVVFVVMRNRLRGWAGAASPALAASFLAAPVLLVVGASNHAGEVDLGKAPVAVSRSSGEGQLSFSALQLSATPLWTPVDLASGDALPTPEPGADLAQLGAPIYRDSAPPRPEDAEVGVIVCEPATGDRRIEYRQDGYGPVVGVVNTCDPLLVEEVGVQSEGIEHMMEMPQ